MKQNTLIVIILINLFLGLINIWYEHKIRSRTINQPQYSDVFLMQEQNSQLLKMASQQREARENMIKYFKKKDK